MGFCPVIHVMANSFEATIWSVNEVNLIKVRKMIRIMNYNYPYKHTCPLVMEPDEMGPAVVWGFRAWHTMHSWMNWSIADHRSSSYTLDTCKSKRQDKAILLEMLHQMHVPPQGFSCFRYASSPCSVCPWECQRNLQQRPPVSNWTGLLGHLGSVIVYR